MSDGKSGGRSTPDRRAQNLTLANDPQWNTVTTRRPFDFGELAVSRIGGRHD